VSKIKPPKPVVSPKVAKPGIHEVPPKPAVLPYRHPK
jgi:hypothetical protein